MIKTRLGAIRYNNRMDKIWNECKRLECDRLSQGEEPNKNLTDTKCTYCGIAVANHKK